METIESFSTRFLKCPYDPRLFSNYDTLISLIKKAKCIPQETKVRELIALNNERIQRIYGTPSEKMERLRKNTEELEKLVTIYGGDSSMKKAIDFWEKREGERVNYSDVKKALSIEGLVIHSRQYPRLRQIIEDTLDKQDKQLSNYEFVLFLCRTYDYAMTVQMRKEIVRRVVEDLENLDTSDRRINNFPATEKLEEEILRFVVKFPQYMQQFCSRKIQLFESDICHIWTRRIESDFDPVFKKYLLSELSLRLMDRHYDLAYPFIRGTLKDNLVGRFAICADEDSLYRFANMFTFQEICELEQPNESPLIRDYMWIAAKDANELNYKELGLNLTNIPENYKDQIMYMAFRQAPKYFIENMVLVSNHVHPSEVLLKRCAWHDQDYAEYYLLAMKSLRLLLLERNIYLHWNRKLLEHFFSQITLEAWLTLCMEEMNQRSYKQLYEHPQVPLSVIEKLDDYYVHYMKSQGQQSNGFYMYCAPLDYEIARKEEEKLYE